MTTLVFLLEEPSAEEMLKGILPRLLPEEIIPKYLVFEGKQDLDKRLEHRVRGWLAPDAFFVVIRDKDAGNCQEIKRRLQEKLANAGHPNSLVRIACHELETYYLGDLAAVEAGLNCRGLSKLQEKSKYRTPDNVTNPAQELAKLVDSKKADYQKVAGSRDIAAHLKLDGSNRSHSFNVLVEGLRRLIDKTTEGESSL